jgi:hypothetical protein
MSSHSFLLTLLREEVAPYIVCDTGKVLYLVFVPGSWPGLPKLLEFPGGAETSFVIYNKLPTLPELVLVRGLKWL